MGVFKIGRNWYIDLRVDGRHIRKVIVPKKSEAIAAIEAVRTDVRRGEYKFKRDANIKIEAFADDYFEYSKTNKKSWRRDQVSLKWLKSFFGGMKLSKINPRLIEEYKTKRITEAKPSTVNRELACLKHMYSLAKKCKIINDNPVEEVKLFSEQKIEMKILDRDEIMNLINKAADHIKPIIIVALNTGMRKGEILNLRWNNIDFDKHFIFLSETKSGRMRKIPMNSFVAETLKNINRDSKFVFYNLEIKKQLLDVKRSLKTVCKKAGIKDLRFHDLRHTAATIMITGGVDLVTVSEILGHSDIRTTMRYAHPTPENKKRAFNVLAAVFGGESVEEDMQVTDKRDLPYSITNN